MNEPPTVDAADGRDSARFRELLRAAFERLEEPTERPEEEVLLAYLGGTATESERAEVEDALVRSPQLRSELLDLARDLERLSQPDALARFESVEVPHAAPVPLVEAVRRGSKASRVRSRLWNWKGSRGLFPLAALAGAAVIFLLMVLREEEKPAGLMPGTLALTADQFAPLDLRGETDALEPSPTAEEAALRSFMAALEYRDGRFVAAPVAAPSGGEPRPAERACRLEIVDDRGRLRGGASVQVPASATHAQVWLLSVPDLRVGHVDLVSDRVRILWPDEIQGDVYALVSFETTDGFLATEPKPVERGGGGRSR